MGAEGESPMAASAVGTMPMPQRFGEVVASMLDEAFFQSVYGPDWVLADGRTVTGTWYEELVSANVPDLRGLFLRGRNYDRSKASGNAEGDLVMGTFQAFQVARHSHTCLEMIQNDAVDGVDSVTTHSFEHRNESRQTGEFGGDEVRPNCVTVNFFICVGASESQ